MRIAFLAGLPRAGTTALATILNQNPQVYMSPNSDLCEQMRRIDASFREDEQFGLLRDNHLNLLRGAPHSFYSDFSETSVVIDKARNWGNPYFLRVLSRALTEPPKILSPLRPLSEVVASFVRKAQENPHINFIDQSMIAQDFLPYWRKPIDDARVDWLLSPNSMLQSAMLSVSSALSEEHRDLFHCYSYHQFVNNPDEVIRGIYDFIGLDYFEHSFDNLVTVTDIHDDMAATGIPDLHIVRPTLQDTSIPPDQVLSDYGLSRCALEDFWTDTLDQ